MISGKLKEAVEGHATLNDVSEGTFARFARWLYTGDYRPAAPLVDGVTVEWVEKPPSPTDWAGVSWVNWNPKKGKKKEDISLQTALQERFMNIRLNGDDIYGGEAIGFTRPNESPDEDFTPVLLSHAEIYVFADKYDIQNLKKLAMSKLKHTLTVFTLYPSRVGDVLALLRYVWSQTAPARPSEYNIRTMLMFYVMIEVGILNDRDEFREMLAEDTEMMREFLAVLTFNIYKRMGH